MADPVLELAERGRALTPEKRARLVDLLLVALEDPGTPEVAALWDREIERRIAAYKGGEVQAHDLEGVLAEARCIAPRRRYGSLPMLSATQTTPVRPRGLQPCSNPAR